MSHHAPVSPSVPRWARVVDLLCFALLIVAAIVAVSGGFRQRLGGLRIGVTSPYPLLLWAMALTVARHLAAPQHPVYRDLPRVVDWVRDPAVRAAGRSLAGTRPAIFIVGYLAVFMIGFAGGRAPLRHFDNELLNLPVRWDAGWYLQIVTDGYKYIADDPERQQNIVFFPAYPMLVRGVGRLLGGHMEGYVVAGTLISLAAFLGALVYLYRFSRSALDEDAARTTVWLLAAYPFALFFGAIYTESLFLLATLGAFYHFTKAEYPIAGFWGWLAGLTRVNGVFLCAPLLLLALTPWLPSSLVGGSSERGPVWNPRDRSHRESLGPALIAASMPAVGLLIYAAYIWRLTGDPLAWASGHSAWGRTHEGLAALVSSQYSILSTEGLSGYVASPGYNILNAMGALFAIAAIWPVSRRIGLAYGVFILINTLPPLASGGLLSAGRFSSIAFPAFIWLARAIPTEQRTGWIATFAALQAFNAALYYTWRPLF